MEELQPEMAATTATTTTTTTTTATNNNSDSDASPGRSSPASQQSEPGSRAAPDAAATRPDVQATAAGSSRRRRAADWEIMQGLRTGQRCDDKPKKFEGYLLKRRKWPLKGWHKRFFCLEKGILTYAKSSTDMAKGKNHGSVDLGLSVISTKGKGRRIDIDAEEFIYHLKVKNQAQFQQWVSQLQHHRLYRQHEITFGSREAPKMTSPAAEDSGGVPGGTGPSGALTTICKCPLNDSPTCRRHHCYRELMLCARTCTQACLTGPVLGSQGFNTCKCSKKAAKESAASENPQVNADVSSNVPSTSTNDRELVILKKEVDEDVMSGDKNLLAGATYKWSKESMLAADTGKSASQMPFGTEPKFVAETSDEVAISISAGRGATTCGIDTDRLVVTFYPALGSKHTNSLTCDTSSEEIAPTHAFDENICTGEDVVDVTNQRKNEKQIGEAKAPTVRLNSLATTHHNRSFNGLQALRQGTDVGVNTDSDGETVEREHNTSVKIMGHSHPRVLLKGHKKQNAPTPQVIVDTLSTDKSALTHPERVDQLETLKQQGSSRPRLIDCVCGTQCGFEPEPEHLSLHSTSPQGTSSSVKTENLAGCDLPEPSLTSPDIIMPPSHSDKDTKDLDSQQAVPHLSFQTIQESDTAGQDFSFSVESRWPRELVQSKTRPCSDGNTERLNKGPCKQAELGLDWVLATVESCDDSVEGTHPVLACSDVALPAVSSRAAGQVSGLSRSDIVAESQQSGQSSAQYCTALPEETGSELRDTLQTFLFLHSDSSFFANLQHSPGEIPKLKYGELGICQTANQSSEHSG